MPIRPLADFNRDLIAARASPEGAEEGLEPRAIVRFQNAVDAAVQQKLDALVAAADAPSFEVERLSPRRLSIYVAAPGDARHQLAALKEATDRLRASAAEVEQVETTPGGQVNLTFSLAPHHPVRLRIAQLLQAKYPPVDVAERCRAFVRAVLEAAGHPSADAVRTAQEAYASDLFFGRPPVETLTHRWTVAVQVTDYFPWQAGAVTPCEGGVDPALREAGRRALEDALGEPVSVKHRRYPAASIDGESVTCAIQVPVPESDAIVRQGCPPGHVPDRAAVDAMVAAAEKAIEAALQNALREAADLASRNPFAAAAERPSSITCHVDIPRDSGFDGFVAAAELRAKLQQAGYAGAKVNGRSSTFSLFGAPLGELARHLEVHVPLTQEA